MTVDDVLRDLDRLVTREEDLHAREARRLALRSSKRDDRKERFAAAGRIEAENRARLIAAVDEQERRRAQARAIAVLHNER
jgi:hypothetical protein